MKKKKRELYFLNPTAAFYWLYWSHWNTAECFVVIVSQLTCMAYVKENSAGWQCEVWDIGSKFKPLNMRERKNEHDRHDKSLRMIDWIHRKVTYHNINLHRFNISQFLDVLIIMGHKVLTSMSKSRNGERTKAVNVLDTTVGGFFSGSLNRCCINNSINKKNRNEVTNRTEW